MGEILSAGQNVSEEYKDTDFRIHQLTVTSKQGLILKFLLKRYSPKSCSKWFNFNPPIFG